MKIITLNNLKEFLSLMKGAFGKKEIAIKHRNALDTYVLNIDYSAIFGDATSSKLDTGKVEFLILA